MYLLDLSHTSHTRARTGIQRVTRSLHTELTRGQQCTAITWDPYANQWRPLNKSEKATLQSKSPSRKRSARWSLSTKMRGHWSALCRRNHPLPEAQAIIVPELFSADVASALSQLPQKLPRIALFHDALALKLPELSPPGTVARFPGYLQELLGFTGVAAVSEDSRTALLDYWSWLGIKPHPPVEAIALGIDPHQTPSPSNPEAEATPVLLCVGSIEGRKNHVSLLRACEKLWEKKRRFSLRMLGMANSHTGQEALQTIKELQDAGHPLRYDGAVDEATLDNAYAECAFTVYPSLMEGFGLPVLESLMRGKPCICSSQGALGESARRGGTIMLDTLDADTIAGAIDSLLQKPQKRSQLVAEASQRTYRSWQTYTNDLLTWIKTLS